MKTIYIKFRHPEDVYAIYPDYDLSPDDFIPPKICGRCGENLYIPVELPHGVTLVKPLPNVVKPLPKENPNLFYLSEQDPITIEFSPNNKLPDYERQRLKSFYSVTYVDENSWSMLIDDYSHLYVKHECNKNA